MEDSRPYRPRVSRETRLLLTTACLAVVALWILGRMRFPERPVTPNPVPPLLTQLGARPALADLASEIAQVQSRLEPVLVALGRRALTDVASYPVPALRIRDDLAVTMLDPADGRLESALVNDVIARDAATGLAVVRVPPLATVPTPPWAPQRMQQPRYLVATDMSRDAVSLRPVFIGSLQPTTSGAWPGPIWAVPAGTDIDAGALTFTTEGALAGIVIDHESGRAIVPAALLLAEAELLLGRSSEPQGQLGIEVQPLSEPVAKATGTESGVVVTWVDGQGAAGGRLAAGDVIEAIDGAPLQPGHWDARVARLAIGDTILLRVRRRGELHEVSLTAAAPSAAVPSHELGLTMRALSGTGVEVVRVDPGAAADRAGLESGDIITLIGEVRAPTPAQIRRTFAAAPEDRPVLVAFTRREIHRVTALEKQ